MSMLTGLKVSPLACKYEFYRPKHNAKGGGPHGIEFLSSWNAKMKYTYGYCSKKRWKNGVI